MSPTVTALAGFAGWQVLLTFVLGGYRTVLVNTGQKAANSFAPDGSDVGGFGQRLTRARDNCYENLPMFAALALAASISGKLEMTDGAAMWVLYARIGQSITHMVSTSVPAIFVRFGFYLVQLGIWALWAVRLVG